MKASKFLLRQGTISSILTIILLILSLLFVNWQIEILGIQKYGLLVLLLSIFGTINLLNIGIGTAIVSYYTRFGDDKSVFWSIFIASFLLFLLVSIILLIVTSFFYQFIFSILSVENRNLNFLAFIGFVLIGVSRLLGSIISSYWVATVNFFKLKIFGFISVYFSITVILFLNYLNFSFNDSLFYAGIANLSLIIYIFFHLLISSANVKSLNITHNTKIHLKDFLHNGSEFQAIAVINNLSGPAINVMINTNFGLEAISLLDIALRLLRSGRQILISSTEPFFGKMTELYNKNKQILLRLLTLKYTKLMIIAALVYFVTTLLLSRWMLTLWMGSKIAISTYFLVNIISIGYAINIASSIIYNQYLSMKKMRKYIIIHQLMLLVFPIIPFFFDLSSLNQYAIYYSLSFAMASLYLFIIFYKTRRVIL